MKKQLIFILLAIPLVFLSSCGKDFTSLSPLSKRNTTNFYKSETDFNTAVLGAYSSLQLNGTYRENFVLTSVLRGDNGESGGGVSGLAAAYAHIDRFNVLPTSPSLEATWSDSYKGIDRCNRILAKIKDADFDQLLKDQYTGEALFIRSLLYYNLAIIFGNVPLKLKPSAGVERDLNQVDAAAVYTQIISDLTTASDLLPASYSAKNVGRATKWAAKSLLGKAYLMAGDKSKAATVFQDVVKNGPYKLMTSYKDIFGPDNENNQESIFEVQFQKGGIGEGSMYTSMFTTVGFNPGVGGGSIPIDVTESVHGAFTPGAGNTRLPVSIANYDSTQASGAWEVPKYNSSPSAPLDASNNWIVMRYADVLLMYAEALGAPAGYQYINKVRRRAGLNDLAVTSDPNIFRKDLLHERRVELAFEGKRWQTLLRFGIAKKVMSDWLTAHIGQQVTEDDIHLLFPIPQQEIDASSGSLKQNPAYQ